VCGDAHSVQVFLCGVCVQIASHVTNTLWFFLHGTINRVINTLAVEYGPGYFLDAVVAGVRRLIDRGTAALTQAAAALDAKRVLAASKMSLDDKIRAVARVVIEVAAL
jgi:hypothetical protein